MADFRIIGMMIEQGAMLMSYGKTEEEIRARLQETGWSENQIDCLIRGMHWRLRAEAEITVTT